MTAPLRDLLRLMALGGAIRLSQGAAPPPGPKPGPPVPVVGPGCAKAGQKRSRGQIVSVQIEPWQIRGWRIIEVPTGEVLAPGTRSEFAVVDLWACPPAGAAPPRPETPVVAVDAGRAMRLLVLADGSRQAVDGALARGEAPGASAEDRAAARAARGCVDALSKAAGPLESLTLELRDSLARGRPARVGAAQAAALEAFAECAAKASRAAAAERARGGLVEAIAGLAIPAAGALLVAL